MSSFLTSPSHHSHLSKCPVCGKDVHKVLIQDHVDLCLAKAGGGAGGGSGGRDARAERSVVEAPDPPGPRPSASAADGRGGTGSGFGTGAGTGKGAGSGTSAAGFSPASAFAKRLGLPDRGVDHRSSPGAAARSADARRFSGAAASTAAGPARSPFAELRNAPGPRGGGARVSTLAVGWRKASGGFFGSDAAVARPTGPLSGWATPRSPPRESKRRAEPPNAAGLHRSPSEEEASGTREPSKKTRRESRDSRTVPGEAEGADASAEGADAEAEGAEAEAEGADASALGDGGIFPYPLRVMSGNHLECGICLQPFDDATGVTRHVLWPCQHVRQCGECAIRVWQTPKAKRRCPWCKSKVEIRPRPFKPFL